MSEAPHTKGQRLLVTTSRGETSYTVTASNAHRTTLEGQRGAERVLVYIEDEGGESAAIFSNDRDRPRSRPVSGVTVVDPIAVALALVDELREPGLAPEPRWADDKPVSDELLDQQLAHLADDPGDRSDYRTGIEAGSGLAPPMVTSRALVEGSLTADQFEGHCIGSAILLLRGAATGPTSERDGKLERAIEAIRALL